ncbi:MAG: sigma-70 family RNA polymerase sigma factor [Roseiflexus sp.]|nr:sigma-70 family RNA polymerase sigma factor [Roseiflexus sp.]MCS7289134.1 sigma-70 family RNA polymerase sigma factor [Roseiflexus sp.]MDW8233150.1 sigma-70 family RNA polymerase sigma factor [Roseiflexaceae bacterium]
MAQQRSWHEVVQECQRRVTRIRAVLTTGGALTPELWADLDAVILAVRNWIYGRARKLGLDEDACSDLLRAVIEQLHKDLRSPGFSSMERKFGAYISTTVNRILYERKNNRQNILSSTVSLDAPVGDDGPPLHEVIEDPTLERLVEAYCDEDERRRLYEAIAALPTTERIVITHRLEGVRGTDTAQMLGVSPATVSRTYERAVKRLRQMLTTGESS